MDSDEAEILKSGSSSGFPAASGSAREVLVVEGEELTEVDVGDEPPTDDDASGVWTDYDDVEEVHGEDEADEMDAADVIDVSVSCFRGHSDAVYSVAVHPQTPGLVITGGGDDNAYIWSYHNEQSDPTELGSNIRSSIALRGHTDSVTSVGFNFDGSLALTGALDGKVKVWNISDGSLVQSLEGPEDIEWAQWHPKGNAIIAGSSDGTAWMWLSHNGQCVQVFAGHDGGIPTGCFTSDGRHVCTGGEDGTVRVWNPKTGVCKHVFEGHFSHDGAVTCIASSSDGDRILTGGMDGKVIIFQISGKRVLKTFDSAVKIGGEGGAAVPPKPPADEDAAEEDDAFDGDSAREGEAEEVAYGIECVGFCEAPGFAWVASGGSDKYLRVWDMISGMSRCTCSHGGGVIALKWHTVHPLITTAALDNLVRVWDARSGLCLIELTGHTDLVTNLDFRCGAFPALNNSIESAETADVLDVIVSVSDDRTARVFHVSSRALLS